MPYYFISSHSHSWGRQSIGSTPIKIDWSSGRNSKDALWRVQLPSVSFQVGERFFEVGDETVGGFGFDDHIVDVSFDIVAYLLVKTYLDGPLVGCPGVFSSKRLGGLAIRTERHDEWYFDLVILFEGYLVIAGVIVKEGEQFTADGGVYNLVYPS